MALNRASNFCIALVLLTPGYGRAAPSSGNAPIDCHQARQKVLADLSKLNMDNDQVVQQCLNNSTTPANNDHEFVIGGKGDCQITYRAVSWHIQGVGKEIDRACELVNEGKVLSVACRTSGQAECLKKPAEKFRESAGALKNALELLRKGQESLKEQMVNNADTAEQYANYLLKLADAVQKEMEDRQRRGVPDDGNYNYGDLVGTGEKTYGIASPSEIVKRSGLPMNPAAIRKTASSITGTFLNNSDPSGLDRFSGEQYAAYKQGKTFLDRSAVLEKKVQSFSSRLEAQAAQTIDRGNWLGAVPSSTISDRSPSSLSAAAAQKAAISGENEASHASGASGAARAARGGQYAQSPNLDDNDLFSTFEGKPVRANKLNRHDGPPQDKSLAGQKEHLRANDDDATVMNITSDGPALAASTFVAGLDGRNTVPKSSTGSKTASANAKGSSTLEVPGLKDAADAGEAKGKAPVLNTNAEEALAKYAAGSAKAKERNGPSLRDLLRQKMAASGSNSATRAMHEVLGAIELSGDEEANLGSAEGGDAKASQDDIKGIDSEPLFVRVRVAHLRFQKTRTDLGL